LEGFNPFESSAMPRRYNPFDQWFDQEIPTRDDTVIECTSPPRPDIIDHAKHYFDIPEQLKRQQTVDKYYIKPKKFLLDKIQDLYEAHFKNENVLGIMARGTEYNYHHPMYGLFDIDDYILAVRKKMEEKPEITKLFIVSEDMHYVEKLSKAFPNSYFMENAFRRTDETDEYINRVHCWPNVSTKREDHCNLLGQEVIIQTKLLGKCDHIIGRFSGVLAGGVLWSENLKSVSIL
jgi:hypothetical protein